MSTGEFPGKGGDRKDPQARRPATLRVRALGQGNNGRGVPLGDQPTGGVYPLAPPTTPLQTDNPKGTENEKDLCSRRRNAGRNTCLGAPPAGRHADGNLHARRDVGGRPSGSGL